MTEEDAWAELRRYTQARIALGRSGHAVPTRALLDFQLAHARARDAVHLPWGIVDFAEQARSLGADCLVLETPVQDRSEYLRRPDLGRVLTERSRECLRNHAPAETGRSVEVALAISNGLSSTAVERHGIPLLKRVLEEYRVRSLGVGPVCLVENGRVALSDDIGSALGARIAVIVVGERPGLSAADSLGIYLTHTPKAGNTDAERNCISNVRPPEGLGYAAAARKLAYLTMEAIRRRLSGVALKDDTVPELEGKSG